MSATAISARVLSAACLEPTRAVSPIVPGSQLQIAGHAENPNAIDVVDAVLVEGGGGVPASARRSEAPTGGGEGEETFFAAVERTVARADSPNTRSQYAGLYRRFGDWLIAELGRPACVGDLDADAIAACVRHLEAHSGRGGQPASLAT